MIFGSIATVEYHYISFGCRYNIKPYYIMFLGYCVIYGSDILDQSLEHELTKWHENLEKEEYQTNYIAFP